MNRHEARGWITTRQFWVELVEVVLGIGILIALCAVSQ